MTLTALRAEIAVAGALVAAAVLARWLTLDFHSLWYDEAVTLERVIYPGFGDTVSWVLERENHPPLWYLAEWPVLRLAGTGEVAARALSAAAVTAMIPVAYLTGRELRSPRTGLILMALVAVSPFLYWYSQEARPYALYALAAGVSFLLLLRARRTWATRDLALWAVASVLAAFTHHFAVFGTAAAAMWLLMAPPEHARAAGRAVGAVAVAHLALVPYVLSTQGDSNNDWIARTPLGGRVGELVLSPLAPLHEPAAIATAGLAVAAVVIVAALARDPRVRPAMAICLSVAGAAALAPLALAVAGMDYFLARNAIAWLLPALAALALALDALPRPAGWAAALLIFAGGAHEISRSYTEPELRRDDWRAVARQAQALDPRPPVIVGGHQAWGGLSYYLDRDEIEADTIRASLLATTALTSDRPDWLPAAFRRISHERLDGGVIFDVWRAPRPVEVELPPDELFTQGSFRLGPGR